MGFQSYAMHYILNEQAVIFPEERYYISKIIHNAKATNIAT